MLLAYIDETGEPGAYVSPEHPRYHTSPAFGYAGFVIPDDAARDFGARFQREKRVLFASELGDVEHPGRWERKGARIFRPGTAEKYPQQFRVFNALVGFLMKCHGRLFYYADEKPQGTPKQTHLDPAERETQAMSETLNRLARYAKNCNDNLLVMLDQVNEKTRRERVADMYAHVFRRTAEYPEMRRVIEPPMHIDSILSANIQFADWVAAFVSRAIDFQLVRTSKHQWVTDQDLFPCLRGSFTYESKLHLYERSVRDINHSHVLDRHRPLHPVPGGHLFGESVDPAVARKMRAVAEACTHPVTRDTV